MKGDKRFENLQARYGGRKLRVRTSVCLLIKLEGWSLGRMICIYKMLLEVSIIANMKENK